MNEDKCKICNLTITSYDNVKVCPKCGEVYHKSCFENSGCVNKNCKEEGTEVIKKCEGCGSELKDDALFCSTCGMKVSKKENVCPHCKAEITSDSNFCPICGFNIHATNDVSLESREAEKEGNDVVDFVGEKGYVYYSKFKEMEVSNKKITFNWCSFLFGGCWFVYRKMWLPSIVYIILSMTISFLDAYGYIVNEVTGVLEIVLWVLSGIFGNLIYMKHVNRHVAKAKNLDEDQKFYYFKRNGGTSVLFVVLYLALSLIISTTFLV